VRECQQRCAQGAFLRVSAIGVVVKLL
jgi:hypothetical protein